MLSVNKDSFIFSFPIWIPSISFSCFILLPRTSSTMLNGSSEGRCHCLVSDLRRENIQSFIIKYNLSCRFFINTLYQIEGSSILFLVS